MTVIKWNSLDEPWSSARVKDWPNDQKGIQCAINCVKNSIQFMLLNIVLFLQYKCSTSHHWPNALLKLCFWLVFWVLLILFPPPDLCPLEGSVSSMLALEASSSISLSPEAMVNFLTPASLKSFLWSFRLQLLCGYSKLPVSRVMLFLLYFCVCMDMKKTLSFPLRKTISFFFKFFPVAP